MEKRTFVTVLLIAFMACFVQAQRPAYRGFIDSGYNFGGDSGAVGHWFLNSTHGVDFIPDRLFVGGGVGVGISTGDDHAVCYSMPLYAAARYTFSGHKVAPYLDVKAGYAFLWDKGRETGRNIGGFYFSPSAGVALPLTGSSSAYFGLGYSLQRAGYTVANVDPKHFNAGGFYLTLGVTY